MTKKILAVLLAVILLAQAAPLTVLAAEETENEPEGTEKIIKLGEPAEENAFESGGRKTAAETSGTAPVQESAFDAVFCRLKALFTALRDMLLAFFGIPSGA